MAISNDLGAVSIAVRVVFAQLPSIRRFQNLEFLESAVVFMPEKHRPKPGDSCAVDLHMSTVHHQAAVSSSPPSRRIGRSVRCSRDPFGHTAARSNPPVHMGKEEEYLAVAARSPSELCSSQ